MRHVGPAAAPEREVALQHAEEADPGGHVEPDHSVTGVQTEVERAAIVAVHDPRRPGEEGPLEGVPLVFGRRLPAGPPVQAVEVVDRQVQHFSQASRQPRFTAVH